MSTRAEALAALLAIGEFDVVLEYAKTQHAQEPEVIVPEITVPEVIAPEITEPEVLAPEVTEPTQLVLRGPRIPVWSQAKQATVRVVMRMLNDDPNAWLQGRASRMIPDEEVFYADNFVDLQFAETYARFVADRFPKENLGLRGSGMMVPLFMAHSKDPEKAKRFALILAHRITKGITLPEHNAQMHVDSYLSLVRNNVKRVHGTEAKKSLFTVVMDAWEKFNA